MAGLKGMLISGRMGQLLAIVTHPPKKCHRRCRRPVTKSAKRLLSYIKSMLSYIRKRGPKSKLADLASVACPVERCLRKRQLLLRFGTLDQSWKPIRDHSMHAENSNRNFQSSLAANAKIF